MIKKNINLIKSALKLDIFDLNYNYSSNKFNLLNGDPIDLPQGGLIIRFLSFLYKLLIGFFHYKTINKSINRNISLMILFTSQNQKFIADIILSNFNHSIHLDLTNKKKTNFPLTQAFLYSILFLPKMLMLMLKSKGYIRKSFNYAFDYYLLTYGVYIISRKLLQINRPRIVLLTNDHIMWTRTFRKAAFDEGIDTVYIQHATVTEKFPLLSYNYSLLDGYDTLKKYSLAGKSNSIVFLVGSIKFDKFILNRKNIKSIKVIGISNNTIDSLEKIESNIIAIRQEFKGIKIILRPHPSDPRRKDFIQLTNKYNLIYSDSRIESSYYFLKNVDLLISSDSGIILEATIMNIYTIYFNYNNNYYDLYSYFKNGLVDSAITNKQDLIIKLRKVLKKKEEVYRRAKYYCASIDTQYEGNSIFLVIKLLNEIINKKIIFSNWKRINKINNIIAYSIKESENINEKE